MRFWFMEGFDRVCVYQEEGRMLFKEDLHAGYLRALGLKEGGRRVSWRMSDPPFILKELKIKERL